MLFFPESPRYLVETDQADKALVVLKKLHYNGSNEDWIQTEFNEIKLTIEAEKAITAPGWRVMFTVPTWRTRLMHATLIQFFGQMTGINVSPLDVHFAPVMAADFATHLAGHRLLFDNIIREPWHCRRSQSARHQYLQCSRSHFQLLLHRLLPRQGRASEATHFRHDCHQRSADLRSRARFAGTWCDWISQRRNIGSWCLLPLRGLVYLQRELWPDIVGLRKRDHAAEYPWQRFGFRDWCWKLACGNSLVAGLANSPRKDHVQILLRVRRIQSASNIANHLFRIQGMSDLLKLLFAIS